MPEDEEPEGRVTVARNDRRHRYEAYLGRELAGFVTYRERPGVVVLVHTEVDPAFEGHGVGGTLVAASVDDIRTRGLLVEPVCPFVISYLQRHPEYGDLVVRDAPTPHGRA